MAGVFLLLIASFFSAFVGVNLYRATIQREAQNYGEEALRRIFVQNDTMFLLDQASDLWKQRNGNLGVTLPMTEKYLRLGEVENTRVTGTGLRSFYEFPAKLRYRGLIDGSGVARCGQVSLRLEVTRSMDGWRINGFWWQCPNR